MKALATTVMGLLAGGVGLAAESAPIQEQVSIIPRPVELHQRVGEPGFAAAQGLLMTQEQMQDPFCAAAHAALVAAGVPVRVEPQGSPDLTVRRDTAAGNAEAYALDVSPAGVRVSAASEQALFWAAQTLAQSLLKDAAGAPALPSMQVRDEPLLPYRGFMVDTGRSPLSLDELQKILRLMARYKLNRLHWHLTEDQGWRVEIKQFPRLTEVGALRRETPSMAFNGKGDGKPVTRFYTQDEVRRVVDYAHSLGITVIPEIEVPGHSSAALAAYPELGNDDMPGYAPEVMSTWGVKPYVYAPKPQTFAFLEGVFTEICELFPRADIIHIGGDEVPRDHWRRSPAAQQFMRDKGLTHEGQIQQHFTNRMADFLAGKKRRIMGWDEILEDGAIRQDAVAMVWRADNGKLTRAVQAAKMGHDVVLCPTFYCYFDYSQGKEPEGTDFYNAIGAHRSTKDWRHVYSLNIQLPELTEQEQRHIIGLQANAWGEAIHNMHKLEYMCFPRLLALSEIAWTPAQLPDGSRRDADEFAARLRAHLPYLDAQRVNYREESGKPRLD